ncbi:MAG: hypothetical protein K0S36_1500 [Nitrosospira multiformis]|jgi:hypothetical protein|nr:hypothetical protein [Nitrosospira multiformis]
MAVKTLEQISLHVCLLRVITALKATLAWTNFIKGNKTDNG